ncbi:MAG TPA: hypothetical protein VG253_03690 [Streptosporangiaceae bacterium]|nr:hypothetical protein [Streptosporangiaceae bacterium]
MPAAFGQQQPELARQGVQASGKVPAVGKPPSPRSSYHMLTPFAVM